MQTDSLFTLCLPSAHHDVFRSAYLCISTHLAPTLLRRDFAVMFLGALQTLMLVIFAVYSRIPALDPDVDSGDDFYMPVVGVLTAVTFLASANAIVRSLEWAWLWPLLDRLCCGLGFCLEKKKKKKKDRVDEVSGDEVSGAVVKPTSSRGCPTRPSGGASAVEGKLTDDAVGGVSSNSVRVQMRH